MNLRLCKKGVKLQKHNQFRHAGPRSPEGGISCLYQRLEFPHQVRDDALFELQHLIYHQIQRSYIELTLIVGNYDDKIDVSEW